MPEAQKTLCDSCHKREATYHTTICGGGAVEKRSLCPDCFQSLPLSDEKAFVKHFADQVAKGRCKYCGEPATGGSGGPDPLSGEKLELWCERCRQDLVQFWTRSENKLPEESSNETGAEGILQFLADIEVPKQEFMRQRVWERKLA